VSPSALPSSSLCRRIMVASWSRRHRHHSIGPHRVV
jgi:hypothetical protein